MKNLKGLNARYIKYLPICGILLVLSMFLPYLFVSSEKISISGMKILTNFFQAADHREFGSQMNVISLLIGLPILMIFIFTLTSFFVKNKAVLSCTVVSFVIGALCSVLVLFVAKKTIDTAQIMTKGFLISDLGAGYWAYLVISFVGLTLSMRAVKINPGYIVLTIMSIVWILPIAWITMISFREEGGSYTSYFWPKHFTLKNYRVLLTDSSQFYFVKWFFNTLFVAACSCAISTVIVLSTAFSLSRLRFKGRKGYMNLALILGMFPGFMSMIAVYYILKGLGLTQSLIALILVYSGGSALGYYIVKGFFDTIPKALDEAAIIDGATKWKVFTKITIPLSKPVIIYTMLISFISPWGDFIFARVIMGDNYDNYTVALGLYTMLDRANIATWYTRFAAGSVLVSIPIALLFISLQKYYVEGLSGSVKG
jgi:arabinogalactan oligomer / maltooligosaccharide transport system permease protein